MRRMGDSEPTTSVGRPAEPGRPEGQALRSEIEAFECRSERERASRRRFLAELSRLDRPFDREADLVDVTGSTLVVGARGVVLHRHKHLGLWLQPGGHLDPGEFRPKQPGGRPRRRPGSSPEPGPRLFHIDVHEAYAGHIHPELDVVYARPSWLTEQHHEHLHGDPFRLDDDPRQESSGRWSPTISVPRRPAC